MDENVIDVNNGVYLENEDMAAQSVQSGKQAEENYDDHNSSSEADDVSDDEEESVEDEGSTATIEGKEPLQENDSHTSSKKSVRGKKRRKPENRRKNIRKILKMHQLDPKTLEAQKEEQERLQRLELQRSLSDQIATEAATVSIAPKNNSLNTSPTSSPSKQPILILDDGDDSDYSDSSNDEVDIHFPSKPSQIENVILISSSDSEDETKPDEDEGAGSDSSEDCTNLISAANLKSHNGDVLINTGHMPDEPDIFLPPQIARVIKPHQILGVRFLYENLIESIKNFKTMHGLGCILAHAMGLGKTIQTVSLIHIFLRFTESKKVLVLVPINTLQNWLNEFDMWVPAKPKEAFQGTSTESKGAAKDEGSLAEQSCIKEQAIIPDEEEKAADLSGECSSDCNTKGLLDHEMKQDNQTAYEEKPDSSSAKKHSAQEKVSTEYRDYDVFIINDSQKNTVTRANIVDQWHTKGGVLLMGYEMFRMISLYKASLCNSVTNAKGKKKKKAKTTATVIDIDEEEKEMQLMLDMQKAMCDPGPDLVVCDEGHRIKNHQSNIHHALHKIRTRKRLVLTGYPLQNNLTEYWCMVDFVRPNYLGSRQEFQNMFERPIVNGQCIDSTAEDKKFMKYRAHVLSSLLKGFVQRKDYTALKVALPPKEEHVIMVRMSPIQEAVYRRFISSMQEGYGDQLNPIKIFAVCSKIWNHPDILYKAMIADQSKKAVLFDTEEDIITEDGLRLKNPLKLAQNQARSSPSLVSEVGFNPFAGDAKTIVSKITDWAKEVFDSHQYEEGIIENGGKIIILMELIKESLAQGDKMLIFSQSLSTLDLVEEILNRTPVFPDNMETDQNINGAKQWRKNVDYFRIDGTTTSSERERLIDLFNREDNQTAKLFLLSTRAGCLGINLVGANRVVVFDVSWNPCHDAQAVCRVYRYGQQKPCYIYRLISSNTMEKRMYYRQISKQGVSDRVIDEMNPVENFSKDELTKLLSTSWEDEPQCDFTNNCELINDPVLKTLCQKCAHWIVNVPFQHESLLKDQTSSKLSNREKREAKKGYEEEKRKAVYGINGPLASRILPHPHRPTFPLPDVSRVGIINHAAPSIQDQMLQNTMLSNLQLSATGAQSHAALVSVLRHVQQLRSGDSSAAQSRLLSTLSNETQLQNVLYRLNSLNSSNAGLLNLGVSIAPQMTAAASLTANGAIAGFNSLPNLQMSYPAASTNQEADNRVTSLACLNGYSNNMVGSNLQSVDLQQAIRSDNEDTSTQSMDDSCHSLSEPSAIASNVSNQDHCRLFDNTEVICIDSDGENE